MDATRLYETSYFLLGARKVIENSNIKFDSYNGKDKGVYNNAIRELLMRDDNSLLMYLADGCVQFYYYAFERDKKGRLTKCKATTDIRFAEKNWKNEKMATIEC